MKKMFRLTLEWNHSRGGTVLVWFIHTRWINAYLTYFRAKLFSKFVSMGEPRVTLNTTELSSSSQHSPLSSLGQLHDFIPILFFAVMWTTYRPLDCLEFPPLKNALYRNETAA
jgi:hypothetical protein